MEKKTWKDSLMYEDEGDTWPMIIFKFFFPICLWLGVFCVSYLIWGDLAIRWGAISLAYLFPPLGKESIIPLGVADGFHPMVMALTVFMVDTVMAMIISWNYYILEKIPLIGRIFKYAKSKGAETLDKHPSIKTGAFLGIFAIVSFPFIGAGGTTSGIVGRMIGLKPYYVISAVAFGSLFSGIMYAYAAEWLIQVFAENVALGIALIIA
ncbi:MAG: small multi-drug export protein, partial [Thermoplasmata archaeon]